MRSDDHRRLVKIVGLLASPSDGERANAALRATEILARNGLTWEEVVSAMPVEVAQADPDLFVLDDVARMRSDLAVSDALRNQLAEELDEAKAKLGEA